jgi:hypothetical protein
MYADDAAGRAARFADISSRVPGRDKLVRLCAATDFLHDASTFVCSGVLAEMEANSCRTAIGNRCIVSSVKVPTFF